MDIQKELIAEYDKEIGTTRKMFEAIPADADYTFKPNPKSMSLGQLAGHLSDTAGQWASSTLAKDKVEMVMGEKYEPYIPASKDALLDKFSKETTETKGLLASFAPAKWDENWKFIGNGQVWIDETKYQVWRTWVINHLVHHRAQLGVYLRLLGKPIPGSYGPSADEM